ncbi:MAG: transcriptional regulator, partial [bacterium]
MLGVTNDGAIDGVPMHPEEVQERLSQALQTALSAPVQARLGRHLDARGWVHWIEVARVRGPEPLRCRGRVLVRRGRASVDPSATEL